jgi:hypothetical protein
MPKAPLAAALTATTAWAKAISATMLPLDHAGRRFDGIPMVLETINPDIWAEEIAWLKAQQTAEQAA